MVEAPPAVVAVAAATPEVAPRFDERAPIVVVVAPDDVAIVAPPVAVVAVVVVIGGDDGAVEPWRDGRPLDNDGADVVISLTVCVAAALVEMLPTLVVRLLLWLRLEPPVVLVLLLVAVLVAEPAPMAAASASVAATTARAAEIRLCVASFSLRPASHIRKTARSTFIGCVMHTSHSTRNSPSRPSSPIVESGLVGDGKDV